MITTQQVLDARIKPKDWSGQPVRYCQEKKDGWGMSILLTPDGYHAIGRKGEYDLSGTPIEDTIAKMPVWSCLHGEIHVPGVAATSVITAINEKWQTLQFDVFAVPWWAGDDYREIGLETAMRRADDEGIPTVQTQPIPERLLSAKWTDLNDYLIKTATERKIEGYVLKNGHLDGWYKVKPVKTVDLVVVGANDGREGKFADMVGSIDVGFYGEGARLARCSGMNDAIRHDITEMHAAGTLVGRVVEVSYQSVAAKGGLQFPQFVRWREDKPANECTRDQLKC